MNFTSASFIIDVVGMLLLAAVIFYTIRLNQHFQMLQKNRAELARQLSGFAHSTDRAEVAIQQVRQSTRDSAQQMEDLLQKAETLKADLGYLVDRAGSLADRLEGGVRRERDADTGGARTERSSRRSRGGRMATAEPAPEPIMSAHMAEPEPAAPAPRASARKSAAPAATSPAIPAPPPAPVREAAPELPARRKRRGGRINEGADDADPASNSELLKVLQGMR